VRWAAGIDQAYTGASRRLMSQASAKAMLTPGLGHWGLGVEVGGSSDDLNFGHGGDDAGFNAKVMAWPKGGRAVAAMANGDDGGIVVAELLQAVAREYGWKGLESRTIDPVTLTEAQIKEVSGSYGHGLVVISADGPSMSLTYGGARVELIAEGGDQFIADAGSSNVEINIGRGADGKISTLSAQGLMIPRDP
jgi:hypothetical protein